VFDKYVLLITGAIALIAGSLATGVALGRGDAKTECEKRYTASAAAAQAAYAEELFKAVKTQHETQKTYDEKVQQVAASERKYRNADRLRRAAQRESAIAASSAETCRVYASGVTGLFEACRSEYIELGHDAARASAAVEALRD